MNSEAELIDNLMQQVPLNISWVLRYAANAHGSREIVSRNCDGSIMRYDYADMAQRAASAAHWFENTGLQRGERVSSLAWNNHRHLELFFAVPSMGAVLHTANPRLPDEHIAYTVNHAESRVLLYDSNLAELVERLKPSLTTIKHFIELSKEDYDARIAGFPDSYDWPAVNETSAAFLCYTSGTTGDPKGVAYTHRSVVLHALAAGLPGAFGFSPFDVIMPCQSLYHATAWGLPFAGAINGAKFVLPCDKFDGPSLQQLIIGEGVTFSGGVPTIWTMYLDHLVRTGEDTGTLQRVVIGGSAVPRSMAETLEGKYGVKVQQIWGMTEMSPLGVISTPTPGIAKLGDEEATEIIWTRQGRLQFGVELKIVAEDGTALPHDGESAGALLVRGPWVVERYYGHEHSALDEAGWFDTGDIATLDDNGFLRITDRKKDVIKSGGEWISSIDIENVAAGCPGVKVAAVVGVPHPKWEERPILVVEPHDGQANIADAVREWIAPKLVKWWMPDLIVEASIPLTGTGKIDKKALRQIYAGALRNK